MTRSHTPSCAFSIETRKIHAPAHSSLIPVCAHLQPFWTKAFVQVPKTKRAKMKEWGQPNQRAEIGHLIGFQDPWGSTARVLLDRNRVVHSRNVTYDSKSVTNPTPAPTVDRGEDQSVAERDGIEEIIDGFAAMDITEHSLIREGAPIIQEGAAADVPVVNPDPGPEMPSTPDQVSEGMPWAIVDLELGVCGIKSEASFP